MALVLAAAAPMARAAAPAAYVYATDANPKIPEYAADDAGLLTPLTPALAPGVATSAGIAASPDGRTLYVVDQTSNDVSQYAIAEDGTLTPKSPATVATGAAPFGVAVAPDGGHVYVTNQDDGTISVFTVGADGALAAGPSTVPSGDGTIAIALSPDGTSAYATNASAGTIAQFDVDPGDGSLTPKATPTVTTGGIPYAIAVSPDGTSVYVTNRQSTGFVRQFDVGAGGELTPKAAPTVPAGVRPAGILATDDGVYVTNFTSDTLTRYTADGDGALTRVAPDVAAPHSPFGLALSPDGRSLYVAGFGSGTVGQYDVGADGALTAKSPAAVAADVRPVAVATVRGPDVPAPAFDGFVGPIQDGSVVKAGSVVPIAFSLGGFHGLDVLGERSPSSVRVDCDDPGDAVGGDAAESADGLRFDDASGAYTFAWQTHRSWAWTCRAFVVTLRDGSSARLVVRFRSPHWYRWYRRW